MELGEGDTATYMSRLVGSSAFLFHLLEHVITSSDWKMKGRFQLPVISSQTV